MKKASYGLILFMAPALVIMALAPVFASPREAVTAGGRSADEVQELIQRALAETGHRPPDEPGGEQRLVELNIEIEGVDRAALAALSTDQVVPTLRAHANRTQAPIIAWLEDRGAVVLNTFWLKNLILVRIDPSLLPQLLADFSEVEDIFPNFRVNIPRAPMEPIIIHHEQLPLYLDKLQLLGPPSVEPIVSEEQQPPRPPGVEPIVPEEQQPPRPPGVEPIVPEEQQPPRPPGVEPIVLEEQQLPRPPGLEPILPQAPPPTWGVARIRAPELWAQGIDGEGIRIAVLDTGVHIAHPTLEGRMWTADPEDPEFPGGWIEFDAWGHIVQGSVPHDTETHGTFVSSIAMGSVVEAIAVGVAPGAYLMHALVLPDGEGTFNQVIAGMQWARMPYDDQGNFTANPADVVVMARGVLGFHDEFIEPVENMRGSGIVPVAMIGNDGVGTSTSPGNVFAAFGIGATDIHDVVADFSGGQVVDWPASHPQPYIKPDFTAPGFFILGAFPPDIWAVKHGTSFATAFVGGAVALILDHTALTVFSLYQVLRLTAVDLGEQDQDIRYGWGRIDAFNATFLLPYEIHLVEGWNLMSLPLIPLHPDIEVVLAGILDDVIIVWHYDAATEQWKRFIPGGPPDTLTEMRDGRGYWIYMATADTLSVLGTEIQPVMPEYPVFTGWNHIGFKSIHNLVCTSLARHVVAGTMSSYYKSRPPGLSRHDAHLRGCPKTPISKTHLPLCRQKGGDFA